MKLIKNLLQTLKNLTRKPTKPKERILYAITKGTYLGLCVIFVNPTEYPQNGSYAAISFGGKDTDGGMDPMEIPEKDVINGLQNGILDKIRKVPPELYELCCNEYKERLKRKEKDESSD